MRTGEGVLGTPELVDDALALLPGTDRPGLDRSPACNNPGEFFPVVH